MIISEVLLIERIYIITSLITAIGSLFLGLFVYLKNPKRGLSRTYFFMGFSIFICSISSFFCHTSNSKEAAFFWIRMMHFGSIFIPITFFHFTIELLALQKKKVKWLLFGYIYCAILSFFVFTPYFVRDLQPKSLFRIWPVPGPAYVLFMCMFVFFAYYSLWLVFKMFRLSYGAKRHQLKFIFIGLSMGWVGGLTNFAYFNNFLFPPIGNFFVLLCVAFLAYAIVNRRLMDISLAFTRTGIFLFVYSVVFGLPFAIGFGLNDRLYKYFGEFWWIVPLLISAVSAALGPYVYLFFQKRAEDRIYYEQRQYHETLRKASLGMGRIKDLDRLLNLISHIVTRALRIEHCDVYLFQEANEKYILKISTIKNFSPGSMAISYDSPFIRHLINSGEPIVYEEISNQNQYYVDKELCEVESVLEKLKAAIVVPCLINKKLIAFFVLGEKKTKKMFTQDDVSLFSVLSGQAALAIENAQFYEDMRRKHEQLIKAEKMATIGTMADGLSHQMNNRLHAIGFISGDALDNIKTEREKLSEKDKIFIEELEFSLGRIMENVKQGGEIVEGLLKYSRKSELEFAFVDLSEVLDSAIKMISYKININLLKIKIERKDKLPKVYGIYSPLLEVFFNLIENSCEAIREKKEEAGEPDFKGIITINVDYLKGKTIIVLKDNGIGIKPENIKKVSTPFFTTKLHSKKGTGLGMYIVHQIVVVKHKGELSVSSEYNTGTTVRMVFNLEKFD